MWTVHSVLSEGCISVAYKHEHGVISVFNFMSQTIETGPRRELRDRLEEEDFKSKLRLSMLPIAEPCILQLKDVKLKT